MARIPILQSPTAQAAGNATIKTPNLPAVTNAALGEGLMNLGQATIKMVEMKKKADDITNVTAATLSMDKAYKDFVTYQKSPEGMNDDANWASKWSQISSKVIEDTKSMALTPDARVHLESKLSNWDTNGSIRVQADVFKQAEAKVLNSVKAATDVKDFSTARYAIENAPLPDTVKAQLSNDVSNAERSYTKSILSQTVTKANQDKTVLSFLQVGPIAEENLKTGAIDKREYDMIMEDNRRSIDSAKHMEMVYRDPTEAIIKLKDFGYRPDLAEEDRFTETRKAQAVLLEYQEREQKSILDKISRREVDNLEQARMQYRWMDKSQQNEFERIFINPGPKTKEEAEDYYRTVSTQIDSYDVSLDRGFRQQFEITGMIEGMKKYSPASASNLNELLTKRIKDGKPVGFSVYREQTSRSLQDALKSGIFGKFDDKDSSKDFLPRELARKRMYGAESAIEEEFNKRPKAEQTRSVYEQILNTALKSFAVTAAAKSPFEGTWLGAILESISSAAPAAAGGSGSAGMSTTPTVPDLAETRKRVSELQAKQKELNSSTKSK